MQKETLKDVMKKLSPGKLVVLILVGICLAVLAAPSSALDVGEEDSSSSNPDYRTELEWSLITFLSKIEGVGEADVVIYTKKEESSYFSGDEGTGEIIGVLISCEGAGSYEVQSEIIKSVSALFGISTNKIRVLKSEFQKE